MKLTKLVLHFYHFSTIFYGFSKFQAIWSLNHYSPGSMTIQKTPWTCLNCCMRSLTWTGNRGGTLGARFWQGEALPATEKWWRSIRASPTTGLLLKLGPGMVGRAPAAEQWLRQCCSSVSGEGVVSGGRWRGWGGRGGCEGAHHGLD